MITYLSSSFQLAQRRPGNKNRQRNAPSYLEQQLTKRERITKLPLVGALVHKALQVRDTEPYEAAAAAEQQEQAEQQQQQQPEQIEQPKQPETKAEQSAQQVELSNNNNNNHDNNNNTSNNNCNNECSNVCTMVLPVGLGPDGYNADAIQTAPAPSAPPAHLMGPPQYSIGQTNIYTGVPIIVNPYIDFIVVNGEDRYMIRCERKSVLERSVELAKLIHAGPNSGRKSDNHFQISNVDKADFELIVRYMEKHCLPYRDHKHLLKILELADRFNVPDLVSSGNV